MKINCEFIGWSTEGKSLIYNEVDLMSQIDLSHKITDGNQYYGFYPINIPKQEFVGKK